MESMESNVFISQGPGSYARTVPATCTGTTALQFENPGVTGVWDVTTDLYYLGAQNLATSYPFSHDFGPTGTGVAPPAPVINSFTATPASVPQGSPASFSCDVTGATSLTIDDGIGTVPQGCAITVYPASTTTYTLTATNPGGAVSAAVTVTVTPAPPAINVGGVVNAATFDARFSPASIITVFGQNLAAGTATALFQQGAFVPAWTDQAGQSVQVLVGGQPCRLIYVAPTLMNCQLSWTTPIGSPVAVQALKGSLTSNAVTITLTATASIRNALLIRSSNGDF